jgi:fructan beta-fructosidase
MHYCRLFAVVMSALTLQAAEIHIHADKKYLNLPVKNGAPKRLITIKSGDKLVRQFDMEFTAGDPDWWAFMDLQPFHGQELSIIIDKVKDHATIEQSDEIRGGENLYHEKLRPQFHFTAKRGWNNDPNGLVFYKGEYHLFFQHNPYGWNWGNMHWGHAVSRDLVHWQELPEALYPDELGTMFSGSAVVDEKNTAGFQKGSEKTLIALYTAAGGDSPLSRGKQFSQCLAYSNDRGRTWTKYENNPVLPHIIGGNRDPKVLWYAAENKWLMALYLDQSDFAIFQSKDLKSWTQLCKVTIPGTSECPEFFEIPIEGSKENRWIFYGGNGRYLVGNFDGKTFSTESGPHDLNRGDAFYASQTYNLAASDKRRILVPWGQAPSPGMPFNQMIGLPVELKLKKTPEGPRLFATPVKELEKLRARPAAIKDLKSSEFELDAAFIDRDFAVNLHGATIKYDSKTREISCLGKKAILPTGSITLRALVDRTTIDLFIDGGEVYMPMAFIPKNGDTTVQLPEEGLISAKIWPLQSAWK